jgi:hypothetical protein
VIEDADTFCPSRDCIKAGVGGDLVQPPAKPAPAVEPAQPAPRTQQSILERVLSVIDGPEHPVAPCVEHRVVRLDKTAEGIRVAVAGGMEQLALGHGSLGEVILGGTSKLCTRRGCPAADSGRIGGIAGRIAGRDGRLCRAAVKRSSLPSRAVEHES